MSNFDITAVFLDDSLSTTDERSQDDRRNPDNTDLNVDDDFVTFPESLCKDIVQYVELILGLLCILIGLQS